MAATAEDCAQFEPSDADAHRGRATNQVANACAPDGATRRARAEDLAELLRLEATFPGDRLSRRQFVRHLRAATAELWVVDGAEGGLAAYLLLFWHRRRRDGRIYSLVVDAAQRGRGIARALLDRAMARARARRAGGLRLEVREDNAAALALYERQGFRQVATRPAYYDDGAAARCLRWAAGCGHGMHDFR